MRRRQDLILRRMRGERVEVPREEEEPPIQPGDTIQWTPGVDSLLDSLRAPVETLPAVPAESVVNVAPIAAESVATGAGGVPGAPPSSP
jgi:hypothetical protein